MVFLSPEGIQLTSASYDHAAKAVIGNETSTTRVSHAHAHAHAHTTTVPKLQSTKSNITRHRAMEKEPYLPQVQTSHKADQSSAKRRSKRRYAIDVVVVINLIFAILYHTSCHSTLFSAWKTQRCPHNLTIQERANKVLSKSPLIGAPRPVFVAR
jgi:cation transport ATPase